MIGTVDALLIDSVATFLYQLSLIYMKLAHQRVENSATQTSGFTHPLWIWGLILMLVSSIVHVCKFSEKALRFSFFLALLINEIF